MKTEPLTAIEAKSEFDYRLAERLGMMAPDGDPAEDQRVYAQTEAMREVRLLRASDNQATKRG